ncbi:MAG: glycosyltransferase family 2 protein, partial [Candidatus Omnitrophota bacterium]
MKMKFPLVSIVIASHNGRDLLKNCLNSIQLVQYPKQKLEIIVVDNCSQDDSVAYIKHNYPRVKIIKNDVNNYCRANNLGIKKSKGTYVAFLNNDTKVDKSWLVELLRVIEGDRRIGAAGSKLLYPDGRIQNAGHYELPNFYWGERGAHQKKRFYNKTQEVFSLCGAAVLYRRRCFEEVGLFDEDFVMYNEDVDMCFRISQKKWKVIFVPRSIVYHKFHGSGSHELSRYYIERNRLLFIAKHFPEKLSMSLLGNKYFTAEHDIKQTGMIYSFLGDIALKLITQHSLPDVRVVFNDVIKELRRISNLDNDTLVKKISSIHGELELLTVQISQHKDVLEQKERQVRDNNLQLQALAQQLTTRQQELTTAAGQLTQKDQDISSLQAQLQAL